MKRLIVLLAGVLLVAGLPVRVVRLWENQAVPPAGVNSRVLDLTRDDFSGYFSVQLVASEGVSRVAWQVSNDGVNWVEPETAVVVEDFGVTSGPGGDGVVLVSIHPPVARLLRLRATVESGEPVISAVLAYQ